MTPFAIGQSPLMRLKSLERGRDWLYLLLEDEALGDTYSHTLTSKPGHKGQKFYGGLITGWGRGRLNGQPAVLLTYEDATHGYALTLLASSEVAAEFEKEALRLLRNARRNLQRRNEAATEARA